MESEKDVGKKKKKIIFIGSLESLIENHAYSFKKFDHATLAIFILLKINS
jgi:hypothetical protein